MEVAWHGVSYRTLPHPSGAVRCDMEVAWHGVSYRTLPHPSGADPHIYLGGDSSCQTMQEIGTYSSLVSRLRQRSFLVHERTRRRCPAPEAHRAETGIRAPIPLGSSSAVVVTRRCAGTSLAVRGNRREPATTRISSKSGNLQTRVSKRVVDRVVVQRKHRLTAGQHGGAHRPKTAAAVAYLRDRWIAHLTHAHRRCVGDIQRQRREGVAGHRADVASRVLGVHSDGIPSGDGGIVSSVMTVLVLAGPATPTLSFACTCSVKAVAGVRPVRPTLSALPT